MYIFILLKEIVLNKMYYIEKKWVFIIYVLMNDYIIKYVKYIIFSLLKCV